MIHSFTIVAGVQSREPAKAYFRSLLLAAKRALSEPEISASGAWALCEYLDAVDAGDVAMDRPLYRQAVTALSEHFCVMATEESRNWLAERSWAAKTLLGVLCANCPKPAVPLRLIA